MIGRTGGSPDAVLRQRPHKHVHNVLAVACLTAMVAAGCAAGTAPPSPAVTDAPATVRASAPPAMSGQYIALGDSYAAGPGIPASTGAPLGCARSSSDYPALVEADAHYPLFRDVSCSGATTVDMTGPQPTPTGTNPPQLDVLNDSTTLVTVTIGANDIGFADIVSNCLPHPGPTSNTCLHHYGAAGDDVLAGRIAATAPKVAAVLQRIRQRAPRATVLVVGYPTLLPATGASCPETPVTADDTAYLNRTFHALNSMLDLQATLAGVHYVDTATTSVGHDICTPSATRWAEGPLPTSPAAAYHPNALGMRNCATQVLRALHLTP